MILKRSLDELVEYIRGNEFVYVSTREVVRERLEINKNRLVSPAYE